MRFCQVIFAKINKCLLKKQQSECKWMKRFPFISNDQRAIEREREKKIIRCFRFEGVCVCDVFLFD